MSDPAILKLVCVSQHCAAACLETTGFSVPAAFVQSLAKDPHPQLFWDPVVPSAINLNMGFLLCHTERVRLRSVYYTVLGEKCNVSSYSWVLQGHFPNPGRHMHNTATQADAATSAPNFGFTSSHYKKQLMSCCGGGAGLCRRSDSIVLLIPSVLYCLKISFQSSS